MAEQIPDGNSETIRVVVDLFSSKPSGYLECRNWFEHGVLTVESSVEDLKELLEWSRLEFWLREIATSVTALRKKEDKIHAWPR